MIKNKMLRKIVIIMIWLGVWQLLDWGIGNEVLMSGPATVVKLFFQFLGKAEFWRTVFYSCFKIGLGFLIGVIAGVVFAVAANRFSIVEELLEPVVTLMKAIPVASFVVLLLIWYGSSALAAITSFLVVFPNIYVNTLVGIKSTDEKLLEMAKVFHLPFYNQFFYIYRPSISPFLESGFKISLGMS